MSHAITLADEARLREYCVGALAAMERTHRVIGAPGREFDRAREEYIGVLNEMLGYLSGCFGIREPRSLVATATADTTGASA